MAYPLADYTRIYYGWELSKCGSYLEINWFEGVKFLPRLYNLKKQVSAMRKCLTNMMKTVTTICMKVMKVTTMIVPIMMISDFKII